jgi:hypothetical protein
VAVLLPRQGWSAAQPLVLSTIPQIRWGQCFYTQIHCLEQKKTFRQNSDCKSHQLPEGFQPLPLVLAIKLQCQCHQICTSTSPWYLGTACQRDASGVSVHSIATSRLSPILQSSHILWNCREIMTLESPVLIPSTFLSRSETPGGLTRSRLYVSINQFVHL